MKRERDHGTSGRALRDAAINYAVALEAADGSPSAKDLNAAWVRLHKAAVRFATNPRPPGRWPSQRK